MALVKRIEKGSPISNEEYDAVVAQVEENQSAATVLNEQINNTEAVFSVASEAAMTAKWNELNSGGKTPLNGRELYRSDLKQFWKWDSAEGLKAVFSRNDFESIDLLRSWTYVGAFAYSNKVFDDNGFLISADIVWPDGDVGTLDNVTIGGNGPTSKRYNRSTPGKYTTKNMSYNSDGISTVDPIIVTGY